ncbi:hypothetical protein DXA13_00665 [Clostridium sp. AM58-1XD]|nr:hypothetical protein DXA13_00665 [Clostridium sp. AM58-1XD]
MAYTGRKLKIFKAYLLRPGHTARPVLQASFVPDGQRTPAFYIIEKYLPQAVKDFVGIMGPCCSHLNHSDGSEK